MSGHIFRVETHGPGQRRFGLYNIKKLLVLLAAQPASSISATSVSELRDFGVERKPRVMMAR